LEKRFFLNNYESINQILNALSDVGVFIIDLKTGEFSSSEVWKPVSGCLINQNYQNFIHPEDRGKVEDAFKAVNTGISSGFEETYRFLTKDNDCKWIRCRGQVIRNP